LHILITTFTFPPQANGVANVAYRHAIGLLERGHKVTVATGYDPQRNGSHFPQGIEIVEFKLSGNANVRSRYKGDIEGYSAFISSFKGDVICCHCWQIWSTDLAVKAFHNSKAKTVFISHGVSANSRYGWPRTIFTWLLWRRYVWFSMPEILKSFDHIVLLSKKSDCDRFYDNYLIKRLGLKNFTIIPNGIDLSAFRNQSFDFIDEYNLSGQYILLCVGKYTKDKNEEMVLNAYLAGNTENSTLVFIGPHPNKYCQALIDKWEKNKKDNPKKNVLFLHNITKEEIFAAYKAADIYLSGSKTEYFPIVILDAMASGTPFISTNVGCVDELPGGVVVNSTAEMTITLGMISSDTYLSKRLTYEGMTACKENFCWNMVLKKYDSLFKSLCS
jgi:glycosyltransferase involved in cell wall biosynthesis